MAAGVGDGAVVEVAVGGGAVAVSVGTGVGGGVAESPPQATRVAATSTAASAFGHNFATMRQG
ncbi:MAG: hypothetical protein OXE43_07960 [Chloroflexi bacterium]|nr:hypothetical protein [Chloroflexota bacterium]